MNKYIILSVVICISFSQSIYSFNFPFLTTPSDLTELEGKKLDKLKDKLHDDDAQLRNLNDYLHDLESRITDPSHDGTPLTSDQVKAFQARMQFTQEEIRLTQQKRIYHQAKAIPYLKKQRAWLQSEENPDKDDDKLTEVTNDLNDYQKDQPFFSTHKKTLITSAAIATLGISTGIYFKYFKSKKKTEQQN